jgi:hypothetical protein
MYIIRNDIRNAYKTYDGWTTIQDGHLLGLHEVMRFTTGEATRNGDKLPKGSRFVYFPQRRWKDIPDGH